MRNSEIERMQVKDIIIIDNYRFIDIPKSKTKNGVRIIPLHNFVYQDLHGYISKNNKSDNDFIFTDNGKPLGSGIYNSANLVLAKFTGYDAERLEKEYITFYSGRHFWKTLMNSENLGDIEEYFMGHKVTSDVANRYNHRDKQGREKLLKKVKRMFGILDKGLSLIHKGEIS